MKAGSTGITVFISEELGDARLRCSQLKKYLEQANGLIDASEHREHFIEVAGHLIYGIPETLMKMEKALHAAAMAVARWDYESSKDDLRPEKVDELEMALEDVRVRRVRRQTREADHTEQRGLRQAKETPMKTHEAAEQLERIASSIEQTGQVDTQALTQLISALEGAGNQKTASSKLGIANALRGISASLLSTSDPQNRPSRLSLAAALRRVLGDSVDVRTSKTASGPIAGQLKGAFLEGSKTASDEKESRFEEGKPADPTENMSDGEADEWKSNTDKYEDKFKSASDDDDEVEAGTKAKGLVPKTHPKKYSTDEKESRFEEGKPADPTENMSEDDAATWKTEHDKNKDNFKAAAGGDPRWIHAKYPGKTSDGTPFKQGAFVLYYPNTKTFLTGDKAEAAWKKFEAEVADESVYNNTRSAADEKESRFEEGKPADPTENMSEEDAKQWKTEHDKNKDNFKAAGDKPKQTREEWLAEQARNKARREQEEGWNKTRNVTKQASDNFKSASKSTSLLRSVKSQLSGDWASNIDTDDSYAVLTLRLGDEHDSPKIIVQAHDDDNIVSVRMGAKVDEVTANSAAVSKAIKKFQGTVKEASDEKESRFEEGKPADPTKDMSEEDAAAWKSNTDKYEDKFKSASAWKA